MLATAIVGFAVNNRGLHVRVRHDILAYVQPEAWTLMRNIRLILTKLTNVAGLPRTRRNPSPR